MEKYEFEPDDIISTVLSVAQELKTLQEKEHIVFKKIMDEYVKILHGELFADKHFADVREMQEAARDIHKEDYDFYNGAIKKVRKKLFALINKAGSQLIISNDKVSKLMSAVDGKKWIIVEGGEIWADLSKKCNLAGLYAVCETSKHYKEFYKAYRTQLKKVHQKYRTQFDADEICKKPIKLKDDKDFVTLAEVNNELPALENNRNDYINANWFIPYLIEKCGLTINDIFYGGHYYCVSLEGDFGKTLYHIIDAYVENLRRTSFLLMGTITVDETA